MLVLSYMYLLTLFSKFFFFFFEPVITAVSCATGSNAAIKKICT